jgi:hypothetical protein
LDSASKSDEFHDAAVFAALLYGQGLTWSRLSFLAFRAPLPVAAPTGVPCRTPQFLNESGSTVVASTVISDTL